MADNNENVEEIGVVETSTPEAENFVEEVEADAPEVEQAESKDTVAHWKEMSRKNERRASQNYKELKAAQEQLAVANMRIARMELQQKHPQLDDALIDDLCDATTPDGLNEWAEKMLKHFPDRGKALRGMEEAPVEDKQASDKPMVDPLGAAALRAHNQVGKSVNAKPAPGEAYKRTREELKAKREKLNARGKNNK